MEGPQGTLQKSKLITLKQGSYIRETGGESRRRIVLRQGLGLYRGGREIYKRPVKTIIKERKELRQSIKEYQETIYRNIILVRLILERYIGVKGIEANLVSRDSLVLTSLRVLTFLTRAHVRPETPTHVPLQPLFIPIPGT